MHAPERRPIGRADHLRPVSTLFVSIVVAIVCVELAAWIWSGGPGLLWRLSLAMSAVSVALGGLRLVLLVLRPRSPAPPRDSALPRYTVIVPLFREAHMVDGLLGAMAALDYPREKLDIILACEAADPATIAAARQAVRANDPLPARVLVVPAPVPGGAPQTKPRALNFALDRSQGDIVTIYDAEDLPAPDQLRAAARAFAAHPEWAALQAPLGYYNTDDNWLAAQFGLEYAALFLVMLPGFDRLGLPFPLGGTSNHVRRTALDAVGGWDPFNVTEDADLAFRLAAAPDGQPRAIGWIAPPTQEEACYRPKEWFNQRSRWIKGYVQTWLVHMGAPRRGGWRRALMLQLTLGLSLLSIAFYAPVMLSVITWGVAVLSGATERMIPPIFLGALSFATLMGMAVGALGAMRAGKARLLWHVPTMPLYWMLLFAPMLQALWELGTRPFYWHKTEHGVTGARPVLMPGGSAPATPAVQAVPLLPETPIPTQAAPARPWTPPTT